MEVVKRFIQCGLISHSEIMEYVRDYHESIDWEADQMDQNPEDHSFDFCDDSFKDDFGIDVSGTSEEPKLLYRALFPEEGSHPDDKGLDTEYVLLSTSYEMKETYVFPSNKEGQHLCWSEMVGLAERYTRYDDSIKKDDWLDTDKVLAKLMESSGHTYEFVEKLHDDKDHKVLLYKRTDL